MADDGMLMNFEIGDGPLLPKPSFQGGRWKDRLAAKKVAQKRTSRPPTNPSARAIFNEKRYDVAEEEYIGPGAVSRPPKRQRVDHNAGRNANTAAIVSGKLPPGSIKIGGTRDTAIQEETRPAFVSGKLPPGSIQTGGKRSTVFQEETRPAFVSGKLPPGSIKIGSGGNKKVFEEDNRPEIVPGKHPPGGIAGGNRDG